MCSHSSAYQTINEVELDGYQKFQSNGTTVYTRAGQPTVTVTRLEEVAIYKKETVNFKGGYTTINIFGNKFCIQYRSNNTVSTTNTFLYPGESQAELDGDGHVVIATCYAAFGPRGSLRASEKEARNANRPVEEVVKQFANQRSNSKGGQRQRGRSGDRQPQAEQQPAAAPQQTRQAPASAQQGQLQPKAPLRAKAVSVKASIDQPGSGGGGALTGALEPSGSASAATTWDEGDGDMTAKELLAAKLGRDEWANWEGKIEALEGWGKPTIGVNSVVTYTKNGVRAQIAPQRTGPPEVYVFEGQTPVGPIFDEDGTRAVAKKKQSRSVRSLIDEGHAALYTTDFESEEVKNLFVNVLA